MKDSYDKLAMQQASKTNIYGKIGAILSSSNPLNSYCECKVNSKYLTVNCNSLKEASLIAKQLPEATISLGHISTTDSDNIRLLSPDTGDLITLTEWNKQHPLEAYNEAKALNEEFLDLLSKDMLETSKPKGNK